MENDWFEIDRHMPDVKVEIAGEAICLDYDNTDIFEFGRGYGMFNHLHIRVPVEVNPDFLSDMDDVEEFELVEDNFVFNCDDLIKALIAHDFPRHYFPYPPEDIVDFYLTNSVSNFDNEIEGLGDGK